MANMNSRNVAVAKCVSSQSNSVLMARIAALVVLYVVSTVWMWASVSKVAAIASTSVMTVAVLAVAIEATVNVARKNKQSVAR